MNYTSIKTFLLVILVNTVFLMQAFGQSLTAKEKSAIHAMHILSEVLYDYYHNILWPVKNHFNESGQFQHAAYTIIPPNPASMPYEANANKYFYLTRQDNVITGGYSVIRCNYIYFTFKWNNDAIEYVTAGKKNYKLEYNSAGLISQIDKYSYRGEGKEIAKVKPTFNWHFLTKKIKVDEANRTWSIELTRYKEIKKQNEPDVVEKSSTVTITQNGNKIVSSTNYEVALDDTGLPVAAHYSYPTGEKATYTFEHDEKGWVKKCSYSLSRDDVPKGTIETYFRYVLKPGADAREMCSYHAEQEQKLYNIQGDVITETRPGEIRKKDADGNWGPWEKGSYQLTLH
jgi:hypothetical protein